MNFEENASAAEHDASYWADRAAPGIDQSSHLDQLSVREREREKQKERSGKKDTGKLSRESPKETS